MMQGVLLFAHGARDPRWAEPFEAIACLVRTSCPHVQVRLCFLEFMTPDLPTAAADMVRQGCTHLDIVPLFLGAGGHVRRDLPSLVERMRLAHVGVCVNLRTAVGEHPSVMAAIARLVADGLADTAPLAPAQP